MPLELYNTLTRKKELFTPIEKGKVRLYVCGPTVYSDSHVGHAKSYITFDVLHRYLEFLGNQVNYVQNITDVGHLTDDADEGDDKLIEQSKKEHRHPMAIAEYYTQRYYEDMDRLQILRPDIAPRASGHIIEQIELIKQLIERGFAYESGGNVYFNVAKDAEYGKLSGRKSEDQEASGRVEQRSDKRSPQDFALWKRAEKGHILRWPSPWGEGFPGWHIECSAMSMKYLGETIDIHGGGMENQFPHHECEIAQSENATGKMFVHYWMHNNMVTVDGKKMGKSLGNSSYLRDLYREYDPLALRFTILQSHYRGTTEFKPEAIRAAEAGYRRLLDAYHSLKSLSSNPAGKLQPPAGKLQPEDYSNPAVIEFMAAMDDDLNTPKAIAALFKFASATQGSYSTSTPDQLEQYLRIWESLAGAILGILSASERQTSNAPDTNSLMDLIVRLRKEARDKKDFATSDEIRDHLTSVGIALEDGKQGTTWKQSRP